MNMEQLRSQSTNGAIKITPEIARFILENAKFEKQRKIKKHNIDKFLAKIKKGEWDSNHQIEICIYDNKYYLVNGQHRLFTILTINKGSLPTSVRFLDCEAYEDVVRYYTGIDTDLSIRTDVDVALATAKLEDYNWTNKEIMNAHPATKLLMTNFNYRMARTSGFSKHYTKSELLDQVTYYAELYDWYFSIIRGAGSPALLKSKLYSGQFIAFGAITKQIVGSGDFWKSLSRDDGLKKGDPVKLMADVMKSTHMNMVIDYMHMHNAFSRCFGAWIEGRNISVLKNYKYDHLIGIPNTDYDKEESYL